MGAKVDQHEITHQHVPVGLCCGINGCSGKVIQREKITRESLQDEHQGLYLSMEKAVKAKNKFLKLLPRAASAVAFHSHPFSPTRDPRLKAYAGKWLVPEAARLKPKELAFEPAEEPTSPRVSCIGQIKHKKKMKKEKKRASRPKELGPVRPNLWTARNVAVASSPGEPELLDRAPSLSQMKRFASGRDSLNGLNWAGGAGPAYNSGEESEEEDREVIIPFSAPIFVGGSGSAGGGYGDGVDLKPRKEINLWKRRTMTQPMSLQVHTKLGSR
ncbi:hypothetical protein NMG60_11016071 [Bertholletia excelsa]